MTTDKSKDNSITDEFSTLMRNSNITWQSLSDETDKIDRASLRRKVLVMLKKIDYYCSAIGYQITFVKKNKKK